MTTKAQIRKQIKAAKASIDKEHKRLQAQCVFDFIETLQLFKKAKNILLYYSLPDELSTHEVIEKWAKVKNIYLPRVNDSNLMEIVPYDGSLHTGAYNIQEPVGEPVTDTSVIDLIIVPGIAFDRDMNRLGRGKGYYDRFLVTTNAPTIGVGYDCQIVDSLPAEEHDIKLNAVITTTYHFISSTLELCL
ncbi:MAG: 5-formyltetrahydrofolate cyclo-ligase [Muribaculaceae bacterium]|nr:5-formyltetrahydrofolate cyclo-ligase [Muribaculaceae bacterium]